MAVSRLTRSIEHLIEAAEYEADRVAAVSRSLFAIIVLVLFLLRPPPGVPPTFAVLIECTLVCNLVIAGSSWWLATHVRPGRRVAAAFFLADFALFVGLAVAPLLLLDIPPAMFAVVPSFLFGLLMLLLAALRFSPRQVALLASGVVGFAAFMVAVQTDLPADLVRVSPALRPVFSQTANLVRMLFLAGIVSVLVYLVARSRRLLIEALSEAEHATNLSRYLPEPVARLVADQGLEVLSRGRHQEAAVLFADIMGFTRLAERLPPEAIGQILTQIRQLQREAIEQAGGVVDKFIGDAVMAVFGVPEPDPRAAIAALEAAAAIEQRMAAWNEGRIRSGEPPMQVGMGIHYGAVFAGAVGDAKRLEFTMLGDTVNVAQRCERLTRETGVSMVVTRAVLEAAAANFSKWQQIPARVLRGRQGELDLFGPALAVPEALAPRIV
jgi:adenylate cyclase